jgi:hypothetical protein
MELYQIKGEQNLLAQVGFWQPAHPKTQLCNPAFSAKHVNKQGRKILSKEEMMLPFFLFCSLNLFFLDSSKGFINEQQGSKE